MIERSTTMGHCVPAPSYAERAAARIILRRLERWHAAIEARPAFAVAIGSKPSVLTPAA